MLNEDEINALADIFQDRFDKANRKILEYIGSRLKEIGELTPSQARKIQQMYKYGEDLDTITQYLAEVSGQSIDDIEALYEKVAEEGYDWSKPFYEAKGIKQIPFKENKDVRRIIKAMCAVTGKSLKNISRTTAIGVNTAGGFKPVGSFYKETIDSAITAVITGTEDYNSTIRRAVKELGSGGLKIQYESGYRRRLDSAVRQNVLDGVRYVTHEIAVKNGEEFGADGYEISAHSACAPDHLPYQGRQYSKKEYDAIQESLARPIGQWNCGHTAFPIVLGVSHRAYTDKELKAFEQNSNEKITIEGREYTRYECTQLQRKLETKLRYAREEKALYKAVGDKELVNVATEKIRILKNKYTEVSEKADLPMRAERTRSVAEELKKFGKYPSFSKKGLIYDSFRKYTENEIKQVAHQTNFIADKYVSKESKWSGNIIIDPIDNITGKRWTCDISVMSETSPHIILHEQLHARSVSYFDRKVYKKCLNIEEASVQFLTQEISKLENIEIIESVYDNMVDELRNINRIAKFKEKDIDFAKELFSIDLDKRFEWLENKVSQFAIDCGDLEMASEIYECVDAIERWKYIG